VVQDLMFPLMSKFTMAQMLGIDPAKAREYARPIHNMSRRDYPPATLREELAALSAEFHAIIEEKRFDQSSMLTKIAALEINGAPFSTADLVKVAFNLLIGGFGTTAAFTGSVFVFLARNPDLRQQIIDAPEIIPSAIDEMLRLFTPTQTFARRVERDTELCGFAISEGDQLLMGYGAANFDPRVFENPEQVDFKRSPNKHMSFGTGPHRCLGEAIARSVLREVLTLMVTRIPDYELVEEGVVAQSFSSSMFGYSNVQIRF
jgi:cytochrome P450